MKNEHLTTDRTINNPLLLPRTVDYSSLNYKAPRSNISYTTKYYIKNVYFCDNGIYS